MKVTFTKWHPRANPSARTNPSQGLWTQEERATNYVVAVDGRQRGGLVQMYTKTSKDFFTAVTKPAQARRRAWVMSHELVKYFGWNNAASSAVHLPCREMQALVRHIVNLSGTQLDDLGKWDLKDVASLAAHLRRMELAKGRLRRQRRAVAPSP